MEKISKKRKVEQTGISENVIIISARDPFVPLENFFEGIDFELIFSFLFFEDLLFLSKVNKICRQYVLSSNIFKDLVIKNLAYLIYFNFYDIARNISYREDNTILTYSYFDPDFNQMVSTNICIYDSIMRDKWDALNQGNSAHLEKTHYCKVFTNASLPQDMLQFFNKQYKKNKLFFLFFYYNSLPHLIHQKFDNIQKVNLLGSHAQLFFLQKTLQLLIGGYDKDVPLFTSRKLKQMVAIAKNRIFYCDSCHKYSSTKFEAKIEQNTKMNYFQRCCDTCAEKYLFKCLYANTENDECKNFMLYCTKDSNFCKLCGGYICDSKEHVMKQCISCENVCCQRHFVKDSENLLCYNCCLRKELLKNIIQSKKKFVTKVKN